MGLGGLVSAPVGAIGGVGNKIGGSSPIDFLAGGGATTVGKYDDWDEAEMQRQRDAQASSREGQDWLAGVYRDRIAGRAPSVAEQQLAATNAANKRQQLAMARSGQGGALGQASAMRMAQMQGTQADLDATRSAALLRAQEQATAEQGLGALYGQQRAQDQGMFEAEMGYQDIRADSANAAAIAQAQADESYKTRRGSGVAGIAGAAGTLGAGALMASDPAGKVAIIPTVDAYAPPAYAPPAYAQPVYAGPRYVYAAPEQLYEGRGAQRAVVPTSALQRVPAAVAYDQYGRPVAASWRNTALESPQDRAARARVDVPMGRDYTWDPRGMPPGSRPVDVAHDQYGRPVAASWQDTARGTARDRAARSLASATGAYASAWGQRGVPPWQPAQSATDWLRGVTPVSYQYRDPALQQAGGRVDASGRAVPMPSPDDPRAPRVGVLTTDLARSSVGRSMVVETPRGEAIDPARATGPMIAAQAAQRRELDATKAKLAALERDYARVMSGDKDRVRDEAGVPSAEDEAILQRLDDERAAVDALAQSQRDYEATMRGRR